MGGYFVDSSALVQRYVHETGSVWLSGLVAPVAGNDIYIAVYKALGGWVGAQWVGGEGAGIRVCRRFPYSMRFTIPAWHKCSAAHAADSPTREISAERV